MAYSDGTNPQYVILFHHFREFLKIANKNKIDIMLLKGAHLLSGVYPENANRGILSDIDFLVKPEDWKRAQLLMEEYGFVSRKLSYSEENKKEKGYYYNLENGKQFLFEIHQYIFEPSRIFINHKELWQRAQPSFFEGEPCFRMSEEDLFCHIALHEAMHRLMSHSRTLTDVEMILSNTPLSFNLLTQRAREWKCTRVVWLYLYLLRKKNFYSAYQKILLELSPPLIVKIILLFLVSHCKETRLSKLNHRVQAGLLWPFLLDDFSQTIRIVSNHPLSPFEKNDG